MYRSAISGLVLEDVPLGPSGGSILYDMSMGQTQPVVLAAWRCRVFDVSHGLAHPVYPCHGYNGGHEVYMTRAAEASQTLGLDVHSVPNIEGTSTRPCAGSTFCGVMPAV